MHEKMECLFQQAFHSVLQNTHYSKAFHVFETPCIFFLLILTEYSMSIMRKNKSIQIFTLDKALNQALP
jgi:hypothetical protein